ncbi:hypothetical protein RJT34_28986 [Clitoria ternatea]|uniref:Seed biotin-containing protein SBP65 n=1 Tax=Clitoria ternatea TaxID=43366 RepID=A0AAN9IAN2_CLITE
MASEQLARRENTTVEREIHVEKDRVPKMATHFEHLAEQARESDLTGGKDTPQGSIEALQGGEYRKDHAGKAIGDVGGPAKTRETHELGTHFESLSDIKGERDSHHHAANVIGNNESEKAMRKRDQAHTGVRDVGKFEMKTEGGGEQAINRGNREELESHHRAANVIGSKESEKTTRERDQVRGGVRDVGKFEMKTEGEGDQALNRGNREELDKQTREVTTAREVDKERGRENKGQAVAEKGRTKEEKEAARGSRVGTENEGARATAVITCTIEKGGEGRAREEDIPKVSERSTRKEISKDQTQQSLQERYERAKQAASETLSNTTQTAQERASKAKDAAMEKATQAKDATLEKGQQGYEATKGTISSVMEKTAPVAEKAKEYTVQAAVKAKNAGGTTAQYVGETAVKAKDVTVESGKTAAEYAGKLAADLKDKATAAGWAAAHFSTEKTVEGTKAAAHVVEGAAGYAGQKASELASKSVGAVKGLAASAGETAKEYTARKKEEAQRELEAKKASQPQEGIGETVSQYAQKVQPSEGSPQQEGTGGSVLTAIGETVGNVGEKIKKPFQSINGSGTREKGSDKSAGEQGQGQQGNGSQTLTCFGEKLGDAAQRMKEPLDKITEGGGQVLEAVTETVGEIGETMIKPAERVQEHGLEGQQEGGMLSAIGETIVEIAQTTKVMVAGEGQGVTRQSVGSQSRLTARSKHDGSQSA